jgi:hypothetical protein
VDAISAIVPAEQRSVFLGVLQRKWYSFAFAKGPGSDHWRHTATHELFQKDLVHQRRLLAGSADMRLHAREYYARFTDGGQVLFDPRPRTDFGTKYTIFWNRLDYRERSVPVIETTPAGKTYSATLYFSPDGLILSLVGSYYDGYVKSFIETSLLF